MSDKMKNVNWLAGGRFMAIGLVAFGLSLRAAPAGDDGRASASRSGKVAHNSPAGAPADQAAFPATASGSDNPAKVPAREPIFPDSAQQAAALEQAAQVTGEPLLAPGLAMSEGFGVAQPVDEDSFIAVTASVRVTGPLGTSPRCTGAFCTVQKLIGEACDCHAECNDDLRCNGEERCEDDGTGTFRCVAGADTQPSSTAGCLEDADMPGGDVPGDSTGVIPRCQNGVSDCATNTGAACLEPQICVEVTCNSQFCTGNYTTAAERQFCFDAPGGIRASRCVDDATRDEGDTGAPGTCTVATQVADCPSNECLEQWSICKCTSDAHCYNNDCNEARGYCNPTGYECDHTLPVGDANAGNCELVVGTCCEPGTDPAVDPPFCGGDDIIFCNALGGTWTSDRESTRNNTGPLGGPITDEIGCLNNCARYSSGIRYPDQGNSVGGGAPGVVDLGPIVEVDCNANGFTSVGDDYKLAGGQPIVLERFSFTGGTDSVVGNTLVFQFYDTSFNLAAELRVSAGRTRGIRSYGSRQNPLYRSQGMPQPVIPAEGFIVMTSPTLDAHGDRDIQGHWFTTNTAPIFGDNDPTQMWINGVFADQSIIVGAGNNQVLSFELRGVPIADTTFPPLPGGSEACCASDGLSCTDTLPWLCSTCSNDGSFCTQDRDCWRCTGGTNPPCWSDAQCANLGAGTCDTAPTCGGDTFLARQTECLEDANCTGVSGDCIFYANANAITGVDEFGPSGYCLNTCAETPCDGGACCQSGGACTFELNEAACIALTGSWQGPGTDCDPNCCPASSTGGEYCHEAVPYVLSVPTLFGEKNVQTITTSTADSAVGAGTGPVEGECEYTSCSITGYCAGAPATSCSVVAQDCAGVTGPCIDRRCQVDGDCPGVETCRRKPCAHQKPVGDPLACAPGRCQSDGSIQCRTAGDCPLGVEDDSCLGVETCERFDCGDPNIPSLGWRVSGSDPIRWESFVLTECAYVTIDYCCTDDNPNHPEGIAQPQGDFFDTCQGPGHPDRPNKYCEGLNEPDIPGGTKCDYCEADDTVPCTTDGDCSGVGGVCVKGVDVCLVGTCSGALGGGACQDANECPLGACSVTTSLSCRRDGECPAGETCIDGAICVGGQACERLRDFCGPDDAEITEREFPDPDGVQSSFGWFCNGGDANWARQWELPPGVYYFPIRALQTCAGSGINCNSDNDCPDGDVCQEYEHEYQIHITTEKCRLSSCCRLGSVCEGSDLNDPANWCTTEAPGGGFAGTCAVSGNPCTVADDCDPGTCSGGTGIACTNNNDCTDPEICQADGTCGIRSGTACTSDGDCTVSYTRGDNVTLTETCQPDGFCGYSCHRTYGSPAPVAPSGFCPTAPGAACVGFEECILTDCPQLVCSDDFTTCTDDSDCTAGACQTSGGGGSFASCKRDNECPPGNCSASPFQYCRYDDECPTPFVTCTSPENETCVGGASCDPHGCVPDNPLCSVTDKTDCENTLLGFWKEDVDLCVPVGTPPGENTCFTGSCCTDDTVDPPCKDSAPFDTVEGCATWGGGSSFVPGAACDANPCPVCEIESQDNCQVFDVSVGFISRCDAESGTSIPNWRCADDFVNKTTAVLDRVCWWPAYAPVGTAPECSQPGERPPDAWTLRIYPDLGHIPDEGAEMGTPGGQVLNVDVSAPIVGRVWQNSAPVDDPILLEANQCYWIEINGAGNEVCDVFWATSNRGNDYAMQDFNFPDFGHYTSEDASNADFAWCVSTDIVSNGPFESGCPDVLGACCACACGNDPPICEETTQDACASVIGCEFSGKWKIYRICETSGFKCQQDSDCNTATNEQCIAPPSGDQCNLDPNARVVSTCGGKPANDECASPITISHVDNFCQGAPWNTWCDLVTNAQCLAAGQPAACCTGAGTGTCVECPAGDGPCLPLDINEANNPLSASPNTPCNDIRCATTDGPSTGCAIGGGDLAFDVWYEYTPPICGTVTIQNCNSLPIYDGFGAVYRKADYTPGDECTDIFAGGASEAACNDDACGSGGPWSYQLDVSHGEELIIRMGSWYDGDPSNYARAVDEGCFELNLEPNVGSGCGPPVSDPLPAGYPHDRVKNRYISFDPNKDGNDGISVAFKVELLTIGLGSCDDGTGGDVDFCRVDRAGGDCNVCSTSSSACITAPVDCNPGESCDATGATCFPDRPNSGGSNVGTVWWVGPESPLNNDVHLLVSLPFRKISTDWPNPTHVGDCEIVPDAVYQVTGVATTYEIESAGWVTVETTLFAPASSSWWGDCIGSLVSHCDGDIRQPTCNTVGDCPPVATTCERAWTLPNGVVNIRDINAAWMSFLPGPTSVLPDRTWVDVTGGAASDPPDFLVNLMFDVTQIISAFQGFPYKGYDPKDCPDVPGWPFMASRQGADDGRADVSIGERVSEEPAKRVSQRAEKTNPGGRPAKNNAAGTFRSSGPEISWVPVDASIPFTTDTPNDAGVDTRMNLEAAGGGMIVEFELRVSGWSFAPGAPTLGTYQATLDASGLLGMNALPANPGVDLTPLNNQAWRENPGGNGLNDGAFIATRTCHDVVPADTGLVCGSIPSITWDACPGGAPVCDDKDDFVFAGNLAVGAVSTATANTVWAGLSDSGQCTIDDGSSSYYAGTLVLNVPAGAIGSYTLGFNQDPALTFLDDCASLAIPGVVLTPGAIKFDCLDATDCDDNNACTDDDCIERTCEFVPNFDSSTECCNPATGGITQIDDGEMCTDDSCDTLTGVVSRGPVSGAPDCNANGRLDICDIVCGGGNTCDGIPGSYDCTPGLGYGVPDECDMAGCQPDEGYCQDCDTDGIPDSCAIQGDPSLDCQTGTPNGFMDQCEDDCQLAGEPGSGTADSCDITDGTSVDTNSNGVPDECDPGACCYVHQPSGTLNCIVTTKKDCEDTWGGNFQGIDTECPTEIRGEVIHNGVAVVHVTETAEECNVSGGRSDCVAGDPIDPWTTDPDATMCHQFGVGPESPPIPADFFGPGSDPFTGSACLEGQPLGPTPYGEFGDADTLVRRTGGPLGNGDPFDRCDLPSAIEVQVAGEVVELSLRGTAPITVTYNGGQDPEDWDVAVDRSTVNPPPGVITAIKTHCNGGTYASDLNVQPRFTFTKVSDPGEVRVLDTGLEGIPHVTLIQDPGAVWTTDVSDTLPLASDICTDFHPGVEDPSPLIDCDCNGNDLRDKCDIETGTAKDCNLNAVPDQCDIDSGFSPDDNVNGIPDECDPKPPLTAPYPHDRRKNRYIALDPNKTENDGKDIAFKVELKEIALGSCDGPVGGATDFCRVDRGSDDCNACTAVGNTCINLPIDCAPSPPQTCDPTGETCVNDAPDAGGTNVGRVWWLGPAQSRCEETAVECSYGGPSCGKCLNSWSLGCTQHDDCGPGGLCVPTGQACIVTHLLVSEADRLVSSDWPNPAYVGDCEIVPRAVYGVRAVDVGTSTESGELEVETTQFPPISPPAPFWWGDVVGALVFHCNGDIREATCVDSGDCGGDPCERAWELPNGVTNIDDVTAALWASAPAPPTTVSADFTWVDVHGNGSFLPGSQNYDPPNNQINVSDLQQIISGFGGLPYKFHDPADCPDESDWP